MNILEVKNLYKSYKNGDEKLQIIKDLNFSLPAGKRMVITGESGCGKSTFLNMVGSLDQCDSGQIIVDGRITFRILNPLCAILFIVIFATMLLKRIANSKNASADEEEEDDE